MKYYKLVTDLHSSLTDPVWIMSFEERGDNNELGRVIDMGKDDSVRAYRTGPGFDKPIPGWNIVEEITKDKFETMWILYRGEE